METIPTGTRSYWLTMVAVVAILWNLVGLMAVMMQMTTPDSALAELPADQQAFYRSTPMWIHGAALVAVVCGVIGSVGLFLKRRWTTPIFGVSLLAILIQQGWLFLASDFWKVYGAGSLGLPLSILVIAIGLLILSVWATNKG